MSDKRVSFPLDILLGAGLSGIASVIGYAIVQAVPLSFAFAMAYTGFIFLLYPLMLALMYGGPVVVAAAGLLRGRLGLTLGSVMLIGGLALYVYASVAIAQAAAEAADTRSAGLDGPPPGTIAVGQHAVFCHSECIQVLATTDFDVVQQSSSDRPWDRYRKVTGNICRDDAHRNRTIAFLRLGFVGVCSELVEYDTKVDAAVLVGRNHHSRGDWALSGRFKGNVAYVARIENGITTVLGRWIDGKIEVPLQTILGPLAPRESKVGSPFTIEEVYEAAGLRVSESDRPGPTPVPELLAELERLGDSPRSGFGISDQYKALLADLDGPASIAAHLAPLLESSDVESRKLALLGLEVLDAKNLQFARPALVRGLQSENRDEVYRSAGAVRRVPSNDRGFAIDGLIVAALRFIGDTDDDYMNRLLSRLIKDAAGDMPGFSARVQTWVPADERERRSLDKIKTLLAR